MQWYDIDMRRTFADIPQYVSDLRRPDSPIDGIGNNWCRQAGSCRSCDNSDIELSGERLSAAAWSLNDRMLPETRRSSSGMLSTWWRIVQSHDWDWLCR